MEKFLEIIILSQSKTTQFLNNSRWNLNNKYDNRQHDFNTVSILALYYAHRSSSVAFELIYTLFTSDFGVNSQLCDCQVSLDTVVHCDNRLDHECEEVFIKMNILQYC